MDNSETTATSDTRHRTMTYQNPTKNTKILGNTDPTKNCGERNITWIYRNYKSLTQNSQN